MWIFSQYGFYSIVKGNEEPNKIQLRTRDRKHLENLLMAIPEITNMEIFATDHADYQFRLIINKDLWETAVLPKLGEIDYGNFKNKVHQTFGNDPYTDFLHNLWGEVYHNLSQRGGKLQI